MACACRTTSLRIFVQSLIDLRVANPQLSHRSLLATFPHAQAHSPNRLFGTTSAAHARLLRRRSIYRQRTVVKAEEKEGDKLPSVVQTEELEAVEAVDAAPNAAVNAAADKQDDDAPTPALLTSDDDLAAAKRDGTILEFNPDVIESLAMSLGQTSIAEEDPAATKPTKASAVTKSERSRNARRKIMEEDRSKSKPRPNPKEEKRPYKEPWKIQKEALKAKFPEGWMPRKRLSPDALEGIRALHAQFPQHYTTEVLAKNFEVTPEAIRRILKSRWKPDIDTEMDRQRRWFNRGKAIWGQLAELGKKPPRRWREEGIVRKPHWNQKRGPRTEWPYVPNRDVESVQRKLSDNLL
ncbi:hypothetical protein GGR50DRAFT_40133 [Xylaria sp. CBS 124048]|nr:hypothetical protein GGR50DRAFT_40133 [Xylaria sp. CBS 124048]